MTREEEKEQRAEGIVKEAEADCGCRIPSPFDEVAAFAVMKALDLADAEAAAMRERAAEAVEALRREIPYERNQHPCSTTKRRAAAAIRALPTTGEVGRG